MERKVFVELEKNIMNGKMEESIRQKLLGNLLKMKNKLNHQN